MKDFKVVWTKNAEFDLESIIEYIKTDNIKSAKIFIVGVVDSSRNVEDILFQRLLKDDNKAFDDK